MKRPLTSSVWIATRRPSGCSAVDCADGFGGGADFVCVLGTVGPYSTGFPCGAFPGKFWPRTDTTNAATVRMRAGPRTLAHDCMPFSG